MTNSPNQEQIKKELAGSLANYYKQLFEEFGDRPETVRYSSKESQFRRYSSLTGVGNLDGCRIFDFGCGVGHLLEYLYLQNKKILNYTGVDIVPAMLDFASKKYPDASFLNPADVHDLNFDYGFVSGTFNDKLDDNRGFWKESITSLFLKCEKGIAFNMMSKYVDFQDTHLYYESPEYVFSFVKKNLTPYVVLRHDFETKKNIIPFEFVIYAYKSAKELD